MNPLVNAETGMLYTADSEFLAKIKYIQNPTSFTFIFYSMPKDDLPDVVYLMPGEDPNDYTSFYCETTNLFSQYHVPQTDHTWYLTETKACDLMSNRTEFRVDVSFSLNIKPEGSNLEKNITVVDFSVGGLKFISDTEFETGKTFSFIFSKGNTPIYLTALILQKRPTRKSGLYCYGCRFLDVHPQVESALRGFVFKENLLQIRTHK